MAFFHVGVRSADVPSFSSGSWGASLSGTYTIPWTLKLTSFVLADQCSLLKQYMYRPSSLASKEWSPALTVR